jgi:hypothetical protein
MHMPAVFLSSPLRIVQRVTVVRSRYGASHNVGVGMKEVIARNWEDFVSVGQKYDLCCFL